MFIIFAKHDFKAKKKVEKSHTLFNFFLSKHFSKTDSNFQMSGCLSHPKNIINTFIIGNEYGRTLAFL